MYLLLQEIAAGIIIYLYFSTVFCWNIEKGKVAGSIRTGNQANPQMNEISINPFGRSPQICIIGNGILRVYKFEDPNFKLINQVKVAKVFILNLNL